MFNVTDNLLCNLISSLFTIKKGLIVIAIFFPYLAAADLSTSKIVALCILSWLPAYSRLLYRGEVFTNINAAGHVAFITTRSCTQYVLGKHGKDQTRQYRYLGVHATINSIAPPAHLVLRLHQLNINNGINISDFERLCQELFFASNFHRELLLSLFYPIRAMITAVTFKIF